MSSEKEFEKENNSNQGIIIVFESKKSERAKLRYFKPNQISNNSDNFPHDCSRLININNEAYVFGGRNSDNFNDIGKTLCYRISYINNNKNGGIGEIKLSYIKNTNYKHHSHSVLYSKLYNTIFVLSGHNQNKCEYGKINEKGEIDKWEEMNSLKKARENPIYFLLNEKFIYLVGGYFDNVQNNSYDIFDISTIYEKGIPLWKQIIFITNDSNKYLFEIKGPGIVESNNNIYVLGGYNKEIFEFMAWKISFNNNYINEIQKFESNEFPKERKGYSFYGQQQFMVCKEYFINISVWAKCESIPIDIFNSSF